MQFIDLPISSYIGADILSELITENQKRYGSKKCHFLTLNLTSDPLPRANILLCRDCFVHLSIADIFLVLDNIKSSHIDCLLTTTFLNCEDNEDITTGDWRLLNLEKQPFNFPRPLLVIHEQCTEGGGLYI